MAHTDTENMQLAPSAISLGTTNSSSISASTAVTIVANATFIRVGATSQTVFLKWGATAVTSSNFDEFVMAGQTFDFVIPKDPTTGALFTTLRVIEAAATATVYILQR